MFTADNTDGYTAAELVMMNEALSLLMARGMEESNAGDIINNNWTGLSDTVESLTGFRK